MSDFYLALAAQDARLVQVGGFYHSALAVSIRGTKSRSTMTRSRSAANLMNAIHPPKATGKNVKTQRSGEEGSAENTITLGFTDPAISTAEIRPGLVGSQIRMSSQMLGGHAAPSFSAAIIQDYVNSEGRMPLLDELTNALLRTVKPPRDLAACGINGSC
jgi:hypothetical protein